MMKAAKIAIEIDGERFEMESVFFSMAQTGPMSFTLSVLVRDPTTIPVVENET